MGTVRTSPQRVGPLAPRPLSARNPRIARLRRLVRRRRARDEESLLVVDGPVLLADAVRDGVVVEDVFVDPGAVEDPRVARGVAAAAAASAHVWEVTGGLGPHVETSTPRGVVGVARRPEPAAPVGTTPLHLVLVGVGDPGNVGTLIRTAEAVGAHSVVVADEAADPWAPKVVRSSAGSVWRVPLERATAVEVLRRLEAEGVTRVATEAGAGTVHHELDMTGPTALVLGNEAHGLPAEVADHVDLSVSLPMVGSVESLNVAVAGSVLAFEAVRQRRLAGGTDR